MRSDTGGHFRRRSPMVNVAGALLSLSAILAFANGATAKGEPAGLRESQARSWDMSTEAWDSHPAFSPDGKRLLFVKSSEEFSGWKIWESVRLRSGEWSEPRLSSFAGAYLSADPFFAPDGWLYFISNGPQGSQRTPHLDIWRTRIVRGRWLKPDRLPEPVNSPGNEWFPRLQRDGSLYFGSDRPGGFGRTDIYRAVRRKAEWAVTNLGAPVNGAGDEYEFELDSTGRLAILMSTRGGSSSGDLHVTRRTKAGWSEPRPLPASINTPGLEVGPLLTRDRLYFSSKRPGGRSGDVYSVPRQLLSATRF